MRLIIGALPLHRDLKSEDVLGCKPAENKMLLHFGCSAVISDQASASTCASCFDRPVLSCASCWGYCCTLPGWNWHRQFSVEELETIRTFTVALLPINTTTQPATDTISKQFPIISCYCFVTNEKFVFKIKTSKACLVRLVYVPVFKICTASPFYNSICRVCCQALLWGLNSLSFLEPQRLADNSLFEYRPVFCRTMNTDPHRSKTKIPIGSLGFLCAFL